MYYSHKNRGAFWGRVVLTVLVLLILSPSVLYSVEVEDLSEVALEMKHRFAEGKPVHWGENVPGVKTRLNTDKRVIALTLDACGGKNGSGYDEELMAFLREKEVSATLFINARWIDANPDVFDSLAADPLFSIQNHGMGHKPCSVNGMSVYGIKGTEDIHEVVEEIEVCGRKIEMLTGRKPVLYRSGTAYYDEIAVRIAEELGYQVAGFSVLGDRGATYSAEEVEGAVLSSRNGDIVICHMNHPESGTAEGLKASIPVLLMQGYSFVNLEDYPLK